MLVTYSLTIRRLQQQAARCYSDPDEHFMMMSQTSHRLRRHRSCSKLRSSSSSQYSKSSTSLKDLRDSTSISLAPRSSTLLEVDNKQDQLAWP